jgi:REP element-mobilizing transposase RayT
MAMKLTHFMEENACYFLTSTTDGRKPIFTQYEYSQILCNIIYNLRNRGKMLLLGFVIMPEHFTSWCPSMELGFMDNARD